jgi:hypothetical protein
MHLRCRSCGETIGAADINVQQMIARCQRCHAVFGVQRQELLGEPAGAPWGPAGSFPQAPPHGASAGVYGSLERGDVPMPPGMFLESDGRDLMIRHQWQNWIAWFLLAFALFWSCFPIVFIGIAMTMFIAAPGEFGVLALPFVLLPGLFLLIGLGMGYFALAMIMNSTVIRVSSHEVSVEHGPLPWFGNRQIASKEIAQLFCVEQVHRGRRGAVSITFSVEYITTSNRRDTLISGLTDLGQALFVEQQIERRLGLLDQAVPGEVRRW